MQVVDIVVDICFWVDMILCFCTGHTDSREKVSMSASVVVHRYLRSWFLVDLFSVIPFDDIAVATVTTVLTAQTGLSAPFRPARSLESSHSRTLTSLQQVPALSPAAAAARRPPLQEPQLARRRRHLPHREADAHVPPPGALGSLPVLLPRALAGGVCPVR
jgi:hypothetical protein